MTKWVAKVNETGLSTVELIRCLRLNAGALLVFKEYEL